MKLLSCRLYARILFKKALKDKDEEKILRLMQEICGFLASEPLFSKFFKSPMILCEEKLEFIKTSKLMYNFMDFLISRNEVDFLPQILEFYASNFDEHIGRAEIRIASCDEISQEKQSEIKKHFSTKADIHFSVDHSLLEGVRIYWKGNVLPLSSKDFLKNIKETISGVSL